MLRERKLLQKELIFVNQKNEITYEGGRDIVGWYHYKNSYLGDLAVSILDDRSKFNINEEEYFLTEFESTASESDYHSFTDTYDFKGVYLAFNLNILNPLKYFDEDLSYFINYDELLESVDEILGVHKFIRENDDHEIKIDKKGYLQITLLDILIDDKLLECVKDILRIIRDFYDKNEIHITRMFGSYILLKKINGELKAVRATPIPIKYCPLMYKLLSEIAGDYAKELIRTLENKDLVAQEKCMCNLINETVIKSGYFDTNRALNSCENNVLFGASETMSSAFKNNLIDAAVIVSNNLGTIITTNEFNTQGAVKRMTGLFRTSPNKNIINTAYEEGIIPLFPYTASIDQLEGVKEAIRRGYKRIAVSVAADDNYLLDDIKKLEVNGIKIYKFALCSTGINEKTANIMKENADVVWTCASKYVTELIEPNAIAQVGIKIPVHIMTAQGWEIVKNHLVFMNDELSKENIELVKGEEKPVFLNSKDNIKVLKKKQIRKCSDCPNPCV